MVRGCLEFRLTTADLAPSGRVSSCHRNYSGKRVCGCFEFGVFDTGSSSASVSIRYTLPHIDMRCLVIQSLRFHVSERSLGIFSQPMPSMALPFPIQPKTYSSEWSSLSQELRPVFALKHHARFHINIKQMIYTRKQYNVAVHRSL